MTPKVSERTFEEEVECSLVRHGPDVGTDDATTALESLLSYGTEPAPGGYHKCRPEDYNRRLSLIKADVLDFLLATQSTAAADDCPRSSAGIVVERWTSRLHLPQIAGRRAFRAVVAGPGHPRPGRAAGPLLRQAARNAALEF